MSSIADQLANQAAGFQSAQDLINQAISQHGLDKSIMDGTSYAYRSGKELLKQQIGSEKFQALAEIAPAAAGFTRYGLIKSGLMKHPAVKAAQQKLKEATDKLPEGEFKNKVNKTLDSVKDQSPDAQKGATQSMYDAVAQRRGRLTEGGQKYFDTEAEKMNNGQIEPINESGDLDAGLVGKHADLVSDAFEQYGNKPGLVGGGRNFRDPENDLFENPFKGGGGLAELRSRTTGQQITGSDIASGGAAPTIAQSRATAGLKDDDEPITPFSNSFRNFLNKESENRSQTLEQARTTDLSGRSSRVTEPTRPAPAAAAEPAKPSIVDETDSPFARSLAAIRESPRYQPPRSSAFGTRPQAAEPQDDLVTPGYARIAQRSSFPEQPRDPFGVGGRASAVGSRTVGSDQLQGNATAREFDPAAAANARPNEAYGAGPAEVERNELVQTRPDVRNTMDELKSKLDPRYSPPTSQAPQVAEQPEKPQQREAGTKTETAEPTVEQGVGGATASVKPAAAPAVDSSVEEPKTTPEEPTERPSEEGGGEPGEGLSLGEGLSSGLGLIGVAGLAAGAADTLMNKNLSGSQKAKQLAEQGGIAAGAGLALKGLGKAKQMVKSGISDAASDAEKAALTAAKLGGEEAAESAIPGLGEIAMAATGLYGLIHTIKDIKKEKADKPPAAAPTSTAPQQQLSFDSAPQIDSSSFHSL